MHSDTYKLLKRHCDGLRAQLSDVLPSSTALASLINIAEAESLLAAHDAALEPLPSRWAHVHPVDDASFMCTIEAILGGYRVYWHDTDVAVAVDSEVQALRTRDIFAVHSIDWITEAEHTDHVAQAHETCRARQEPRTRRAGSGR